MSQSKGTIAINSESLPEKPEIVAGNNKTELANRMIIKGTDLIETLPAHKREGLAAAFAHLRGEMESAQ